MIPATRVSPVALTRLTEYLSEEIWRAEGERQPLEARWIRFDRAYRAVPEFERKDFPFQGAANLVIPLVATDVDTIFSRIMGILFAPDNLWSCKPLNDMMVDFAPRLQEFLEWAQDGEIGAYNAICDWAMELCKLGTGVLKQRYRRELKQIYQFRETDGGTLEQQLKVLLKDSPILEHVSLYDFYVPATAKTIQDAAWAAERIQLTRDQLLSRVQSGLYATPVGIESWFVGRGSTMQQSRERLDAFVPGLPKQVDIFECWLDYDPSDGVFGPQAIVATLHRESRSLMRIDYNPYFSQEKPYSAARFIRQDKRFYGIGLCEMLEVFQEEVTTMHNQRLDSATLANSVMLKAVKGKGIKQDEPIIPGRIWLLENLNDLEPLQMGQKFDSTVPYEEMATDYGRRRTGVSDYIAGNSTPSIGYGAASTTMQMLKQGAQRFDQVMREVRVALGESGTRIAELYQQYNQHGKEFLSMGPKDGSMVHQILQFPLALIRNGVSIEVTATSASLNKDVAIRNDMMIMQMLMQYYQQIMMAMSYVVNPQTPEPIKFIALQMAQGGSILVRQILDSYGKQDADKLIPDLQEALSGGQNTLTSLAGASGGGQGAPGGPVPPSGVQRALPPGTQGAGGVGGQSFAGAGFGGGGLPIAGPT